MNRLSTGLGQSVSVAMSDEESAAEREKQEARTVRDEFDLRIARALNAAEVTTLMKARTPAAVLDLTVKQRREMGVSIQPDYDLCYPF
jgi:hypothetical protein